LFGLGGTEQSVIYLSKYIALKKNINVVVAGDVAPGTHDGVTYINKNTPAFQALKESKIDVLIGVSYIHFVKEFEGSSVDKYVYWAHNVEPFWWHNGSKLLEPILDRIDEFVFLTNWHLETFQKKYAIDEDKVFRVIGNGVNTKSFEQIGKKDDFALYSSHPERGLDKVLNDGFLKKHNIPLKVCTPEYGRSYIQDNFDLSKINYLGSLGREALYKQMSLAKYWYYPTEYEETYCITALEMLGHGVIPIIDKPIAGLKETLNGFYITTEEYASKSWWIDPNDIRKYVDSRDWLSVAEDWIPVLDPKKNNLISYVITMDVINGYESKVKEAVDCDEIRLYKAVDGNNPVTDFEYSLFNWKIKSNNEWYNRSLKKGEVGCMLSHISVLKEAYENGEDYVLILEQDFKAVSKFDINTLPDGTWDICFLGRSQNGPDQAEINDDFVIPGYTYNAHAILYRRSGIEKILQGKPERYIMPWDEYLSATFSDHPRSDLSFIWKDVNAIATKKDMISQTSNPKTSTTENTDFVAEDELTDVSDWEAWKKRWLSYDAQTKEWDLIVDEPLTDVFTFPLFTIDFCEAVIKKAEDLNKWETDRHDYYPTIDVLLEKIGMNDIYHRVLKEYAYECAIHMWGLDGKNWPNMNSENFMIKYTEDRQGHLSLHHDYSDISFLLALNEGYEGGGTYFHRQKELHKGSPGHISFHPGAITHKHGGRPVKKGKRYIIVSFCRFDR
jgi:hypothetical protein